MEKILEYFFRQGPLTYYQLDRKLANDNMHQFIPDIRKAIHDMISNDLIKIVEVKDEVEYYVITDNGKNKYHNQKKL